jgi:hypothetical protein
MVLELEGDMAEVSCVNKEKLKISRRESRHFLRLVENCESCTARSRRSTEGICVNAFSGDVNEQQNREMLDVAL